MTSSDAAVEYTRSEQQLPKWVVATAENTKVSTLCGRCERLLKRVLTKRRLRRLPYYWIPKLIRQIGEVTEAFPWYRFESGYATDIDCDFCIMLNNYDYTIDAEKRGPTICIPELVVSKGDFIQLLFDSPDCTFSIMLQSDKVLDRASLFTQEAFQASATTSSESHNAIDYPGAGASRVDWQLIEAWLTDCRMLHGCKVAKSYALPTRLVCLGLDGSLIRVQKTTALASDTKYCTLSHCWGNFPITKLEEANLEVFQMALTVQDLPRTFRDAIAIASRLKYMYLWIDSLCIIQDSVEDWRKESSLMSEVYSNSDLNIAAAGAANGRDGCLPALYDARHCRVRPDPKRSEIYLVFDSESWSEDIEGSPLLKRGWIFQERFLAPRTLYFGGSQLYWECCKHIVAESHPVMEHKLSILDHCFTLPTLSLQSIKALGKVDRFEQWSKIVRAYSKCKLTKPEDKLVALSGVARTIQQETGDEYVAGLWRSALRRGMLWRYDLTPVPKASEYRAPSWSWAAIDSEYPLKWEEALDFFVSILNVTVVGLYGDPYGQIKHASVRLRCGPLRRGKFQDQEISTVGHDFNTTARTLSYFDHEVTTEHKGQEFPLLIFGPQRDRPETHQGLILKATGRQPGEYLRIGYFVTEWFRGVSRRRQKFDENFIWGDKSAVPEEGSYEDILEPDENGLEQYVIILV